jgi:hypothetical protein
MVDVFALQSKLQSEAVKAVIDLEASLRYLSTAGDRSKHHIEDVLTSFSNNQAKKISEAWHDLLPQLITKCVFVYLFVYLFIYLCFYFIVCLSVSLA